MKSDSYKRLRSEIYYCLKAKTLSLKSRGASLRAPMVKLFLLILTNNRLDHVAMIIKLDRNSQDILVFDSTIGAGVALTRWSNFRLWAN